MAQALVGLNHMHERCLLHNDSKLENFLLFAGDCVKLCVFGCAQPAMGTTEKTGTLEYAAPEVLAIVGAHPTAPADIWSFGISVFMLFPNMPCFVAVSHDPVFCCCHRSQYAKFGSAEPRPGIHRSGTRESHQ